MRSPNPLVAIGITTLVTVGVIHSGSARASAPDTASQAIQPRHADPGEANTTTDHPIVVLLPQIQSLTERIDRVAGLRDRSIAPGLLAFAQSSETVQNSRVNAATESSVEQGNLFRLGLDQAKLGKANSKNLLAQALESSAEPTSSELSSEAPEQPLDVFEVPTEKSITEEPTVEAESSETSVPESSTTETTASETPETEVESPVSAADESSASKAPAPETDPIENQVAETPAETPTAQVPEALAAETTDPEAAAIEATDPEATDSEATEIPLAELSTQGNVSQNDVSQPAPVETPADNTLTEPPPDVTAPDAPAAETSEGSINASSRVDVPDYLNPSPNPLDFPTSPEEVELQGTQPITLRQAVDLAIRNSPQLQQVRQQLAQAQAQLDEARAANNPTVSVNASLTQAGQENATQTQDPPFTVNSQGQVVPNPNVRPPETVIQSSDAATLSGNLEVNYALYTSGRRSALIQAAEGTVRNQQLQVEAQTNELILQVSTAYYDLQQAGAQVRIFQSNVAQAEQSLRDAEALERAGVGTRFDVLQAQVDVANARQELTQQLSSFDIARRNLAQLLNSSNAVDLTAADPIAVAGDWNLSLEDSIVQALKNRAELEQQLIQREAAAQQRRAALAQLGPQVNLQGSFGLSNNLDAGNGFLNNYQVGVGVSLNLYDGGAARAQARAQEATIAQAESQFASVQDQIRFQTEQAYSQLQASATNIETTALAVQQAAEALRLARLRFQAGVGTQTDVLRQQTVLAQSQVNNLRAILGYNRALATLQRQVSNLPEGFLSAAP